MSRTYTLNATIYGGHKNSRQTHFIGFSTSDLKRVGYYQKSSKNWYGAISLFFDATTLAGLKSHTIESMILSVSCSNTFNYKTQIIWDKKLNNSTTDWEIEDDSKVLDVERYGVIPTLDVKSVGVPDYGYVIGGFYGTYAWVDVTSATLTVVTAETQKTITYNANGGSGAPSATSVWSEGAANVTISSTVPTRTGYMFKGWSESSTATTATYQPGATISLSGNKILYAVWQIITYQVAYNANGGSGAPSAQTKTYGVNLTLSSTVPTRTGYTFKGWGTTSGATTAAYQPGGTYSANAAVTLYAIWQIITYSVTYNANGGSGAPSAQTKTYGVTLTLSSTVPTRAGYRFLGWATSSTSTTVAYAAGASYTANAALSLFAVWEALKSVISSATNANIGSATTVSWTNYGSFTTKLRFLFGSVDSGEITVTGTSYKYTLPSSWYAQIPSSTSGTATVYLYTYVGSTLVGTSSKTFTASVASSVVPSIGSITATMVNNNSTVAAWGIYLQGYSQTTIAVSGCAAGAGATIRSYAIRGASLSYSANSTAASASATSSVISSHGTLTYTATITDSRGRTASRTVSISVTAYSVPQISSLTAFRANSDGSANPTTGTSIRATGVWTFSAVGSNALTRTLSFKLHTASTYTTAVNNPTSGTWYTINVGSTAIASSYDVQITIRDSLNNTATYSVVVPPVAGISFGLNNDRARFGAPVEKAGLQVDWDAEFNGVIDVTQRRCYATLSSAGWYRVLVYNASDAGALTGGQGIAIDLHIQRATSAENHSITMRGVSGANISFVNESSKSRDNLITKIRYTYNSTSLKGYVDLYYNGSSARIVGVDFSVHGSLRINQSQVIAESLQSVADAPSGETVLTTYDFAANVSAASTTELKLQNRKVTSNVLSQTTYTFVVTRVAGHYAHFLLYGGTGRARAFLYIGFIGVDNSVVLFPVYNTESITFTATYDGSTLTITASGTCWGGIHLINVNTTEPST